MWPRRRRYKPSQDAAEARLAAECGLAVARELAHEIADLAAESRRLRHRNNFGPALAKSFKAKGIQ